MTHRQLRDLGVSTSSIGRAIEAGFLQVVYRGVYSLLSLSALPVLAREQAAILACAPDTYLSHETAAKLWGLWTPPVDVVHITVVGRNGACSRPSLIVHRAATLDRRDHRTHRGLPITSPARTLFDLAVSTNFRQLEHMFDEAIKTGIMRRSQVTHVLHRCPKRRGAKRMRSLNDETRPQAWTRSKTERRLRTLIRKAGLPTPHSNTTYDGIELDLYWPEHRLDVEIDGYAFHSSQTALERDHRRDRRLAALGIIVLRFSARQVWEEPVLVIAEIAAALALRRAA